MLGNNTEQILETPQPSSDEPSSNSFPSEMMRQGIKSLLPVDLTDRLVTKRQINLNELNEDTIKAIKSDLYEISA